MQITQTTEWKRDSPGILELEDLHWKHSCLFVVGKLLDLQTNKFFIITLWVM